MFWWFSDLANQEALKTFTKEERGAAYRAWAVVIVVLAMVMPPVDYFLTFRIETGDALAGGISAAVGIGAGLAISALISPRIWPILARPRRTPWIKS
jgi:hypothetical protein